MPALRIAGVGRTYPRQPTRARIVGVEARNDRTLIILMVALGAVGVTYGIEIGSNLLSKIAFCTMYGFAGVCIGVLLAFAINVTRDWTI